MTRFRYTGQHALHFEHGRVEPDEVFEVPAERAAAFESRPDIERLDADEQTSELTSHATEDASPAGEQAEATAPRRRRASNNDESAPESANGEPE